MLLARVKRTLKERGLIPRGETVIAACSGGPDSMAMTHALHRLAKAGEFSVVVASIDHGLREASRQEVRDVADFAASLGLPVVTERLNLSSGGSVQGRARDARYAALFAMARARGAGRIALGHTADDQAETVLDRILRGAGLRGLSGIHPLREDGVCRPLIDCTRDDVMDYVRRQALPAVHDPSNDQHAFLRVRIRHELLPRLREEDPALDAHLAALSDEAREACDELARQASETLNALMDRENGASESECTEREGTEGGVEIESRIARSGLSALRPLMRKLVFRAWLEGEYAVRPRRSHLEALAAMRPGAEIWVGGGLVVTCDAEWVYVSRRRDAGDDRQSVP